MELSETQSAIIYAPPEGHLKVTASAGAGKTRVLTERAKRLLETNKRGHVLALTFTHKAADEMKGRLDEAGYLDRCWVSTTHSFAQHIIDSYGHTIGMLSEMQIYERYEDQKEIFIQGLRDEGVGIDEYLQTQKKDANKKLGQYLRIFASIKRHGIEEETGLIDIDLEGLESDRLWRFYEKYNSTLQDYGGMDYDDLLLKAIEVLETHEWVLDLYRTKYKFVCVDEAQDLNALQYRFISTLCKEKVKSLLMVGDSDQMIYGFSGASAGFLETSFVQDFSPEVFSLRENYRSSKAVITISNALKPKSQYGMYPIKGEAKLVGCSNEVLEGEWVTQQVKTLLEDGHPDVEDTITLDRMVVIGRNQFVFGAIEKALGNSNITSFKKRGVSKELPTTQAGKLLYYGLELRLNPKNRIAQSALESTLSLDSQSIGGGLPALLPKIQDELSKSILNGILLLDEDEPKIRIFCNKVIKDIKERPNVEEEDNILAGYEAEQWKQDWLLFKQKGLGSTLKGFRNALMGGQLETSDENGLMLSTVHTMKGLERDVVFLVGMVEGVFPDYRADNDEKQEEELNNAFVAVTRSKRLLYLTCPFVRKMPWGNTKTQIHSRYLDLIANIEQCAYIEHSMYDGSDN